MYKVCDCCGELFLENEEHQHFDSFGYVCFLCLEEGFEMPEHSEKDSKESLVLLNDEIPLEKFPKINLSS